jgi:hypothetical protein
MVSSKKGIFWGICVFGTYFAGYAFLVETCIQRKFGMIIKKKINYLFFWKNISNGSIFGSNGYILGVFGCFWLFWAVFGQICISSRDMHTKKVWDDNFTQNKKIKFLKNISNGSIFGSNGYILGVFGCFWLFWAVFGQICISSRDMHTKKVWDDNFTQNKKINFLKNISNGSIFGSDGYILGVFGCFWLFWAVLGCFGPNMHF